MPPRRSTRGNATKSTTKSRSTKRKRTIRPVQVQESEEEEDEEEDMDPLTEALEDDALLDRVAAAMAQEGTVSETGWWSSDPSKQRGEVLSMIWGAILVVLGLCIACSGVLAQFTKTSYIFLGVMGGLPPLVFPILFPGSDANRPFWQRYSTKANVWSLILTVTMCYFFMIYFDHLFGLTFSFPSDRWNGTPVVFYLAGHGVFLVYLSLGGLMQRYVRRIAARVGWPQALEAGAVLFSVVALAVALAVMESYLALHTPGVAIAKPDAFLTKGVTLYALILIISFLVFHRIDEGKSSSVVQAGLDALGSCMLVTIVFEVLRTKWGSF